MVDVSFGPHHWLTYRLGAPYATALQRAGHRIVNDGGTVGLFDSDPPYDPWRAACDRHPQVVLYPHGGGVNNYGLGQMARHPNVVGQFVVGTGEVDMAKLAGDIPTVACGWPWTPLQDFDPSPVVRRVLFAPPHPYKGSWSERQVTDWARVEQRMLKRFPPESGVQWCVSNSVRPLDETAGMIQAADLVVTASATVLRLAVALGRPAVLWGDEHYHLSMIQADDSFTLPPKAIWDDLVELYHYPYGPAQLETALVREASAWRARFVGEAFDEHTCSVAFSTFTNP